MSSPACVLNLSDGTRGAEFSTWGYVIRERRTQQQSTQHRQRFPNLITASASTINVYTVVQSSNNTNSNDTKLRLDYTFGNIAGNIIYITTLVQSNSNSNFNSNCNCNSNCNSDSDDQRYDALVVAFSGQPRLVVFEIQNSNLHSYSLIDLTSALANNCYGSTSCLEQDSVVSTTVTNGGGYATIACILGGGMVVTVFNVSYHKKYNTWIATEPYIIPLRTLSESLPHNNNSGTRTDGNIGNTNTNNNNNFNPINNNSNTTGISLLTGFGDIIGITFLIGYLEPVVVLLHTNPGGQIWCGRLGRSVSSSTTSTASSTAVPKYISALSISVSHKRTALLWCRDVPNDSFDLFSFSTLNTNQYKHKNKYKQNSNTQSNNTSTSTSTDNCLVVIACNTITIYETSGIVQQIIAVNGLAHSTCPVSLKYKLQCNLYTKLSIQLHGSHYTQIADNMIIIVLRMGQIYVLQQVQAHVQHDTKKQYAIFSTGQSIASIGEIASLSSTMWLDTFDDTNNNNNDIDESVTNDEKLQWIKSHVGGSASMNDRDDATDTVVVSKNCTLGCIFAGSRLGDSLLLGFHVDTVTIPKKLVTKVKSQIQKQTFNGMNEINKTSTTKAIAFEELDDYYDDDPILLLEEQALYAETVNHNHNHNNTTDTPDVIPPSDEETDENTTGTTSGIDDASNGGDGEGEDTTTTKSIIVRKRSSKAATSTTTTTTVFNSLRHIFPLDSLINLGPLGPSCEGPISSIPNYITSKMNHNISSNNNNNNNNNTTNNTVYSATAHIFPCGFSSSGGIALVTVPGRDDRVILSEQDCCNIDCMFYLSECEIVLFGLSPIVVAAATSSAGGGGGSGSIRAMRWVLVTDDTNTNDTITTTKNLIEINVFDWFNISTDITSDEYKQSILNRTLIGAGEISTTGKFVILSMTSKNSTSTSSSTNDQPHYTIDIYTNNNNNQGSTTATFNTRHNLRQQQDFSYLQSVTPFLLNDDKSSLYFACLWESGGITIVSISSTTSKVTTFEIPPADKEMDNNNDARVDNNSIDPEEMELIMFYKDPTVTAIDIFEAPRTMFSTNSSNGNDGNTKVDTDSKMMFVNNTLIDNYNDDEYMLDLNEEDEELYGIESKVKVKKVVTTSAEPITSPNNNNNEKSIFIALCRKDGSLEIYCINDTCDGLTQCWNARNAFVGDLVLKPTDSTNGSTTISERPRSHAICADEVRFFFCGPTTKESDNVDYRDLYFMMEYNNMDTALYKLTSDKYTSRSPSFVRTPLRSVGRPSQEQARHQTKLIRKKIITNDNTDDSMTVSWKKNNIYRFSGISDQDGAFVGSTRPFWIVSERGHARSIVHRARHVSPAGTRPRPVSSFCSGMFGGNGYLTIHERVGRVGSQRLTVFNGISPVFDSTGLLPGSGYCVEKIPFGVTVRRILFIDDSTVSTGDHPLYAVLVSREMELDQSTLNSDGLSAEERKQLEDEKEAAKIQKQVEADLGGFDMESEWVEEIEREECFRVSTELGGAPTLRESMYYLWIVDAANKWIVVDSYALGQYEYGIDLQTIKLSDIPDEQRGSNMSSNNTIHPTRLFIGVGTGIVNHNGEDVACKGRVLLFDIKRNNTVEQQQSASTMTQIAELSLCYEKEIFHGAVTTLRTISSEGKYRLVIGAGSDINVEQWGNGKLKQIGFYRATMQILDIKLFKNFLLLSDAYDSLYFLVWRESDKSLTLLAKDYDPIPVYATGIISRGNAVTFICHDDRQNIQLFQYAPGEAAARGGNKLVCRADYHLGSQTTNFMSHYCRSSLLVHSATPDSTITVLKQDPLYGKQDDDNRIGVHCGTVDGTLVSIIPLNEQDYWRMLALQSVMTNAIDSDCSMNRRAYRLYKRTSRRGGCRTNDRKNGIIDGNLINNFMSIPISKQEDIASSIGTSVGLIIDNILEIQCASMIM